MREHPARIASGHGGSGPQNEMASTVGALYADRNRPASARVYIVEDDDAVRRSLELLMHTAGYAVAGFDSAEALLDVLNTAAFGCAVVDLRLPGMSGLDLQDELLERDCVLPLIMLTGHGDVPAAVRALKAGAVDFLEKPFEPRVLLERVARAMQQCDDSLKKQRLEQHARARLAALTSRERQVAALIASGLANKLIASELRISERTVELHRSRVMKKLDTRSVAELVKLIGVAE